jgi:hypothetical protein
LGYYDTETANGERWVRAGDDNVLEEVVQETDEQEQPIQRRRLKKYSKTINNTVNQVKKEVTVGLKMEENPEVQ